MAEIVNTSKSESSKSKTLSILDEEIDLEEKLLKYLQELKRLKKIILDHENNNKRLQEELEEGNQIIENHKILLGKKDKKLNALKCSFEESSKQKIKFFFKGYYFSIIFLGIKQLSMKIVLIKMREKSSDVLDVFIMVTLQINAN